MRPWTQVLPQPPQGAARQRRSSQTDLAEAHSRVSRCVNDDYIRHLHPPRGLRRTHTIRPIHTEEVNAVETTRLHIKKQRRS
jgi:hypothetical protein